MMINKRLINTVTETKKYIFLNVLFLWLSLLTNILMMYWLSKFLESIFLKSIDSKMYIYIIIIVTVAVILRSIFMIFANKMGFLSAKKIKQKFRIIIYDKLLKIGCSYNEQVKTSEVIQVAVDGIEQLETYFSGYLPQFFYAIIAPITLFVVISVINVTVAGILLICVPLIPISIALVQTWAKKLLARYWGEYTSLGDTFLENLQGLTTLKIYQADEFKNIEMNLEAEKFRKITMRVLFMQLNSIIIMDLIAYGGAALGIVVTLYFYLHGQISLFGSIFIILISVDFFIPMRQLGSFFHIAMNGMAASEKIFKIIDLKEDSVAKNTLISKNPSLVLKNMSFKYIEGRAVLKNIEMSIPNQKITAIVGKSGSGKSTLANILIGKNKFYHGNIEIDNIELSFISETSLLKTITYVGNQSYLFKGTVKDNLLMANPQASDEQLWSVLKQVNLANYFMNQKGLETKLMEKAANLSGGQRQRLALARALLHDSAIYIFDEATSNIDVESENIIINNIYNLANNKTIILITHRLENAKNADFIYTLENGKVVEGGRHEQLIAKQEKYFQLWRSQKELEEYRGDQ